MTIIEQIKAEIEKLKGQLIRGACAAQIEMETNCKEEAYDEVLSFLSTLESETTYDTQQYTPRPSVSIEDVARVQFASHAKVFDKKRKAVFDWEQFKEVAGIFYGFGKKDHSDTLESKKPMNLEGLKDTLLEFYDEYDSNVENRPLIPRIYAEKLARHFAEWGAEHLASVGKTSPNDLEEAANEFANQDCVTFISRKKGFIAGAKWMEEQLKK